MTLIAKPPINRIHPTILSICISEILLGETGTKLERELRRRLVAKSHVNKPIANITIPMYTQAFMVNN